MTTQKTVPLRIWNTSVPAYAADQSVILAYDDVAGHYVPVEHLITPEQHSYVVMRTLSVRRYS